LADKLLDGVRGLTGCGDVRARPGADTRDSEFLRSTRQVIHSSCCAAK